MTSEAGYPAHWEADVVLLDGGTAHLRPIRPEDAEALQAMHTRQSPESVYLRFFAPLPRIPERDLRHFVNVDHHSRVALVMTIGEDIIGVARYDKIDDSSAEVAFNIADSHQGRGLGSILLEHLAAAARERGIREFTAEVLPQNRSMLGVFQAAGFEVSRQFDDGVVAVHFSIDPTERSRQVQESREHRAEAKSVYALLHPASVVVIGASRKRNSTGNLLLRNISAAGFAGDVFVVHPEVDSVAGVRAYPSLADLPAPAELAVIAVPAASCAEVVRDAARHGVRSVVIISSGFAETGAEGLGLQRQLVSTSRAYGLRLLGPNSFGLLNNNPQIALNASLAPFLPASGYLGLFSQSGALGTALLASAKRRGLGVSTFVSAGNRADVSGNDLMQYWEEDPDTRVVGLYLESIGNPRKFSRIARRISRSKPVIVVKSDITGRELPPGHSVPLSELSPSALDQVLTQAGVIRAGTIHQLFDVAQVLTSQPLPRGRRVGIIGNSAALSTLVAQRLRADGLEIGRPPVSLHPEVEMEEFEEQLRAMTADETLDSLVVTFTPSAGAREEDIAAALAEAAGESEKTTVACFLGVHGVSEELTAFVTEDGKQRARSVPSFMGPEDAVWALARTTDYAMWREADAGVLEPDIVDVRAARRLIRGWLSDHPGDEPFELTQDQIVALLGTAGLTTVPYRRVHTIEDARAAARELGYPVAIKSVNQTLRHRMELGGVRLNIDDDDELGIDFAALQDVISSVTGESGGGIDVQRMTPLGTPCVIRGAEDPLLGPVVSFSVAGDATELLEDLAYRSAPLSRLAAEEMIRSIKAAPRLFSYQGLPPSDVDALAGVLVAVARIVEEFPEVAYLGLQPVVATSSAVHILGCRIVLRATPDRNDSARRKLA